MDLLLKQSDKRADRRAKASRRERAQQMKILQRQLKISQQQMRSSQQQMQKLVETSGSALQLAAWATILQVQPPGSHLHDQALAGLQGIVAPSAGAVGAHFCQ